MDNTREREIPVINHKFYLISVLVFGLFLVIVAFTIARERTSSFGRASSGSLGGNSVNISRENSYVFVSPASAKADGIAIMRVTVFLFNNQGLGINGQYVRLKITGGNLTITEVQSQSDSFGRAIYDISSKNPGDYTITAEAGGVSLPQGVKVSFRNS